MGWMLCALVVFFVMEQTPIYGLRVMEPDYLMWLRPLSVSSKGTVSPLSKSWIADPSAHGIGDVSYRSDFIGVISCGDFPMVGAFAN